MITVILNNLLLAYYLTYVWSDKQQHHSISRLPSDRVCLFSHGLQRLEQWTLFFVVSAMPRCVGWMCIFPSRLHYLSINLLVCLYNACRAGRYKSTHIDGTPHADLRD